MRINPLKGRRAFANFLLLSIFGPIIFAIYLGQNSLAIMELILAVSLFSIFGIYNYFYPPSIEDEAEDE